MERNIIVVLSILLLTLGILNADNLVLVTDNNGNELKKDYSVLFDFDGEYLLKVNDEELMSLNKRNIEFINRNYDNSELYAISKKDGKTFKYSDFVYNFNEKVYIVDHFDLEELVNNNISWVMLRNMKPIENKLFNKNYSHSTRDDFEDLVNQIEPDSIQSYIQQLQDFETRYAYADTKDAVVEWFLNKYASFGYDEVITQDFIWNGMTHHNIVAVLPGSDLADQYIMVGGHWDSIVHFGPVVEPMEHAPGADDNASACAQALEIARVMKENDYEPRATILFAAFDAEEVGLVGAHNLAGAMAAEELNFRMMLNSDMIANNSAAPGEWQLNINKYLGSEYLKDIALELMPEYTTLNLGSIDHNASGSDSYAFYINGFPTLYYEEAEFSPHYHSIDDIIDNCDIDYCAEVVKLSLSTMLYIDKLPSDIESLIAADPGNGNQVMLSWDETIDPVYDHYEVQWGTESGVYTELIDTNETSIIIDNLEEGTEYYFGVSIISNENISGLISEVSITPNIIPLTPVGFTASPLMNAVEFTWNENNELDLAGYNIYRSIFEEENYIQLNNEPIENAVFTDDTAENHVYYNYYITSIDNDDNESEVSEIIKTRAVTLDNGVVFINDSYDGNGVYPNPSYAETNEFYNDVLSGFNAETIEIGNNDKIGLADIGIYTSVVWVSDSFNENTVIKNSVNDIKEYIEMGGNIIIAGAKIGKKMFYIQGSPAEFGEGDLAFDVFGIQSIEYDSLVRMNVAVSYLDALESVFVDEDKTLPAMGNHILGFEHIEPNSNAAVLFSSGSEYENNSNFGLFNNLPNSIMKNSGDFNAIILGFPLFYMEKDQVESMLQYLLGGFGEVEIDDGINVYNKLDVNQYPNPFVNSELRSVANIDFNLKEDSNVNIAIFNIKGQKVKTIANEMMKAGKKHIIWDGTNEDNKKVSSGVYLYKVKAGDTETQKKMIVIK